MPRLLKAALLAPLIFAGLMLVLISMFYHEAIIAGGQQAQAVVIVTVLGSLILLNAVTFLLGWPWYCWLEKRRRVTCRRLMAGGFVMMALIGLAISFYAHRAQTWQVLPQAGIYGLCGAFVAGLIWRLGIKPQAGTGSSEDKF